MLSKPFADWPVMTSLPYPIGLDRETAILKNRSLENFSNWNFLPPETLTYNQTPTKNKTAIIKYKD